MQATKKRERVPLPKSSAPVVGADVSEVPESEIAGLVTESEVDQRLREWADRENPERLTVRTYLYKYDSATSGDNKALCDRFDEEIPDPHSVGLRFGSGRFLMMVSVPRGAEQEPKVKALRFRCHSRYDELSKTGALPPGTMGGGVTVVNPAPAPGGGIRDSLDMLKSLVEVIAPLMAAQKSAAPDVSKLIEGQYEMVQGLMRRQLSESADLIAEVNRARLESVPEDREPDFMEKLMPFVEKFLPVLLGGGTGAATTAAAIKALPQVQAVLSNRAELARVIAWLDKQHGREQTDQVLRALKVSRVVVKGNGAAVARRPVARAAAMAGG